MFGSAGSGLAGLAVWRVDAAGGTAPEPVEFAASGEAPSTCRGRDGLAFTRRNADADLYRLELGGSAVPVLHSRFNEGNPQLSADGRRIAFESAPPLRGAEIWLADADGSNPTRLTRGPGVHQGSPYWSPDGQVIAFDSRAADGHVDVWTIAVDGSGLHQVTRDPADDAAPTFSRDGRFIYFTSNRTGRFEAWRVPVAGGAEEQLTHGGGALGTESFDGRTLYYSRSWNGALMAQPVHGGEARVIRPCASGQAWGVAPLGVYYEDCTDPLALAAPRRRLRYWDAATGEDQLAAVLDSDGMFGLGVSPDGRSIVFTRTKRTSDLMMIENFR
jgi:Tol biopolymer transport system component